MKSNNLYIGLILLTSMKMKQIKLGDTDPSPCHCYIKMVKKYIMLNYDGDMVATADRKAPLHADAMDSASDAGVRSAETYYSIVQAGDLYYYLDDRWGWLVDSKSILDGYTSSSSSYRKTWSGKR